MRHICTYRQYDETYSLVVVVVVVIVARIVDHGSDDKGSSKDNIEAIRLI
jgi:hypothetical protein